MIDNWRDVFDEAFGRNDKHKARNFTSMALEARNATSHLDARRCRTTRRCATWTRCTSLLQAGEGAGGRGRRAEGGSTTQQRRRRRCTAEPAPQPRRSAAPPALDARDATRRRRRRRCGPGSRWRCRTRTCSPTASRKRSSPPTCSPSMPAMPSEDYATPASFFRITFLTEGLKRVLTSALQRLCRQRRRSGDRPANRVRRRQDAHHARRLSPGASTARRRRSALPGRRRAARWTASASQRWPKPKIAVFVGSAKGTDVSLTLEGRPAGPHALGLHRLAARRRGRA